MRKPKLSPEEVIRLLKESLPKLIPRSKVHELTYGLVSPKTLANADYKGCGPRRIRINGKIYYPKEALIEWLAGRIG